MDFSALIEKALENPATAGVLLIGIAIGLVIHHTLITPRLIEANQQANMARIGALETAVQDLQVQLAPFKAWQQERTSEWLEGNLKD